MYCKTTQISYDLTRLQQITLYYVTYSEVASGSTLSTSDMYFFKKNISTTMCSLIYEEVIEHYITNGSNGYGDVAFRVG